MRVASCVGVPPGCGVQIWPGGHTGRQVYPGGHSALDAPMFAPTAGGEAEGEDNEPWAARAESTTGRERIEEKHAGTHLAESRDDRVGPA